MKTIGKVLLLSAFVIALASCSSHVPKPTESPVPPETSLPTSTSIQKPTKTPTPVTPTLTKLLPTVTLTSSVTPTPTKLPPTATIVPSQTPTSQATRTPSKTFTITAESKSTLAPTNTASPSDFAVLFLTSPVSVGSNATVRIQTLASASCFLSYATPSGTDSEAAGLGETTADAKGVCSWTWKIGSKTKPGEGSLSITANDSTHFLSIVIQ
jgi:hypothetical protein